MYGYFARQDWSCRWGGKNMDLVPKTGLRGRRSVRSFDRLKLVGMVGLVGLIGLIGLVGLITLLLLSLGVSFILGSILLALRLGGHVSVDGGVGRLLTRLVHGDRLCSRSFRLRVRALGSR